MLANSANSYADATIDPRLLEGILSLGRSERNSFTAVEHGQNESARIPPAQWNYAMAQPIESPDPPLSTLNVAECLGEEEEVRNAVLTFTSRALHLTCNVDDRLMSTRSKVNSHCTFAT